MKNIRIKEENNKFFGRLSLLQILFLLLMFSFLIRTPFLLTNNLSPDSYDYINIAHSINDGKGWFNDCKNVFISQNDRVEHPEDFRPPLYPLFLAVIFKINDSVFAAVLANIYIACLNVLLIFLITQFFFNNIKVSIITSLLVSLNPIMLISSAYVWTEQLYLFFVLGALYLFVKSSKNYQYFIVGGLAALAYLTRYHGVILLFSIILWIAVFSKQRIYKLIGVLSSFILFSLPWWLRNYNLFGNPFHTTQAPVSLTPVSSVLHVLVMIGESSVRQTINLVGFEHLSILGFLIFFLYTIDLKKYGKGVVVLYSFLTFVFFCLLWGNICSRYLVSSSITILPFLISILFDRYQSTHINLSIKSKQIACPIIICILILPFSFYVASDVHSIVYKRGQMEQAKEVIPQEAIYWIKNNSPEDSIIMSSQPSLLYYETKRAGIVFPSSMNESELESFIIKYNIDFIALFSTELKYYEPEDMYTKLFFRTVDYEYLKLVAPEKEHDSSYIIYKVEKRSLKDLTEAS